MKSRSAIVVGSGIVGLATAFHLWKEGIDVAIIDRDPEGDKASFGNAAGISVVEVVPAAVPGVLWRVPGWLLDPLGPLSVRPAHAPKLLPWLRRFARSSRPAEVARISLALAALSRRAHADLLPMLAETGLAGDLHESGALTVYETDEGLRRDEQEWRMKRSLGFECEPMGGDAARRMEPALGPLTRHAIFTPQCSRVSDPKALVDKLRAWLVGHAGVSLHRRNVKALASGVRPSVVFSDGSTLEKDVVVVAAGAWSAALARSVGDRVLLESERGYNTTLPQPGIKLGREIVFAERKFVAVPVAGGVRIGGAAEFGGLEARPNYRRSEALLRLATPYLPGLKSEGGTVWAGHRPSTPDSLPVIGRSPGNESILYAFGHGHLGLTYAATTGRLIADEIARRPPSMDLSPYSISRFN